MTATRESRLLPERPHLDHLRSEARHRHAALKAVSQSARLSDAQFLVARDYGFSNWMSLKAEVDRRRLLCGAVEVPVPAMLRLPRERQRRRISDLANSSTAEAALFPATLAGFAVAQLAQMGGTMAALLHFLLH